MATEVKVTVKGEGKEEPLTGNAIKGLILYQDLFNHHWFQLTIPYNDLENNTGSFLDTAHEDWCGKTVAISIEYSGFAQFSVKGQGNLQMEGSSDFQFKGIVTDVQVGTAGDYTGMFIIKGYSPTFLMEDAMLRRTFHDTTVQQVFEKVLKDYDGDLAVSVKPKTNEKIAYAVQYKETNYQFLQRIAMEYAQWLYYDGVTFKLEPPPEEITPLLVDGNQNSFNMNVSIRPILNRMFEYNSETHKHFKSDSKGKEVKGSSQHKYHSFAVKTAESKFKNPSYVHAEMKITSNKELDDEAVLLKENTSASLVVFEGKSEDPNLTIGSIINVKGKSLGSDTEAVADFGVYRITTITHSVDIGRKYSNSFTAIPHTLETPPGNPNVRSATGQSELAKVINNQDPKKLGRVKVEYYWPNDNKKDNESCWMRVGTPYTGNGKGVLTLPEVDDQVLVGYQGDLVERPLVLTSLQHKKEGRNYTFPNNHIKGISTKAGHKVTVDEKANTVTISNSKSKGDFITVNFANNSINITSGSTVNITSKTINMNAATINMNAGDINATAGINKEGGGGNFKLKADKEMDTTVGGHKFNLNAEGNTVALTSSNELSVSGVLVKINGGQVQINKT
jgi:type VI secretion system secreted protein VgrG